MKPVPAKAGICGFAFLLFGCLLTTIPYKGYTMFFGHPTFLNKPLDVVAISRIILIWSVIASQLSGVGDIMKAGRVSRVVQILTALQSGQRYAVDDLAKMSGYSRRTVYRDLEELQKAGLPCYYDKKDRCYTIDSEFFLRAPDLNTQEALSLFLLVYKARNYLHLPFRDAALRAALKIESNLPDEIRRYCNTALRNISIRTEPQVNIDLFDKLFAQLQDAILRKKVVKISYYLPCEQKNIIIDLSPYHLMYINYSWYVFGKSSFHKEVRAFKLSRIKQLDILDKCFVEDEKFDVHEYLGRAWSMMPEGKLYNVKLRFLPEIAHKVAEVQWHKTQRVTFEKDGSAIIEFRVDGLNEITWWILGYGNQVQILAPAALQRKFMKMAESMVKQSEQLLPI